MNQKISDQLDKILALADSSHEGEALGAVRMARQLLSRDGLTFADLARVAVQKSVFAGPLSLFTSQQTKLESEICSLRDEVATLEEENDSLMSQVEFWRRRSGEFEQQQNLSQGEAVRWKQMARETAEKLWDIAQLVQSSEFASERPMPEDVPMAAEVEGPSKKAQEEASACLRKLKAVS